MPVRGIRLLAHRGAAITSAENTLESVRRAREEGADGVELDVQLSADGEPFLFHDRDFRRVAGTDAEVAASAWKDIRELRVFGKHRIPHLEDALEAFEAWPAGRLTLDLHQESLRLAEAVARAVARSPIRDRVSVLDFYSRRSTLLRVREVEPVVRLAVMPEIPWLTDASVRLLRPAEICLGWDKPLTRWLYRLGCRLYDVRPAIRRARGAGVLVSGGVANTPEEVRYVLAQGVEGIWTDDLPMARRTLLEA